MTDLTPITALGALAPADQKFGPLRIAENADLALASLTLRRGASFPSALGLDLPEPGRWSQGQGVAAYWTGPDQWMIEAEGRAAGDFAAEVSVNATGCSITEQSDAWCVFEIVSDRGYAPIRALLEKLVNIDAQEFSPGSATRTGLHHMSVFLIRRAENHIAISSMRSMGSDLWHVLEETAKRIEGELG